MTPSKAGALGMEVVQLRNRLSAAEQMAATALREKEASLDPMGPSDPLPTPLVPSDREALIQQLAEEREMALAAVRDKEILIKRLADAEERFLALSPVSVGSKEIQAQTTLLTEKLSASEEANRRQAVEIG
eukprot:1750686-Pyramimonas_sp.AAC.3